MVCCLCYDIYIYIHVYMFNRMFKVKDSLFVFFLDELESGALRADDAADLRLGDLSGGTTYYYYYYYH